MEPTKVSLTLSRIALISLLPLCIVCDEKPLLLTPYLDKGDVSTARKLSEVPTEGVFLNITLPRSYAGYFTVNKTIGNHMFFWHFPSAGSPTDPLLLWLNGGPTISSMLGLLWENGPVLGIDVESYEVEENPHTWVKNFSMLYIDNPVGVGYSYSDIGEKGHRYLQADYVLELYSAMEQFFLLFPEYRKTDFYVGGQSYAGKYVPSLAHYIHEKRRQKLTDIPLTGIYLGGPYFDPVTESKVFSEYLYAVGAFSYASVQANKDVVSKLEKQFQQGLLKDAKTGDIMNKVFPRTGLNSNDNYVIAEDMAVPFMEAVMTSSWVRRAVHVGNERPYTLMNVNLYNRFGAELLESTSPKLAVLMDNYKVLIYTGDYDVTVSSAMVEAAVLGVPWSQQARYNSTRRSLWRSKDTDDTKKGAGNEEGEKQRAGGVLKGYYSRTDGFCRVVVHGAGHQTPRNQPETSLEMMLHFTRYGCIQGERNLTIR